MKQRFDFEEIRPLYDEEVPDMIASLLQEPAVEVFVKYMNLGSLEEFKSLMRKMKSKSDFQAHIVAPMFMLLKDKTAKSLDLSGTEKLSKDQSYTFISNHRDIVLDAAFLNIMLHKHGFDTAEVAIGDNLLIYPWIRGFVRLNKSFIVKRDVPVRQLLEVSRRLSSYINFALKIKGQSVWIAQREGRSKDSTDRTQDGLIKMLAMGGGKDFVESIKGLNIVPVALSYEFDPCDYLKAKEFQLKRDDPSYKKEKRDDLLNMETGLTGYKGRIHFQIAGQLNPFIDQEAATFEKATRASMVAGMIDKQIHRNLQMFEGNYVAYDLLQGTDQFASHYTEAHKEAFEAYIAKQIGKIDIENKDIPFLRMKILEMYSNPLINYLAANAE